MKSLILAICTCLMLSGCWATISGRTQIVEVPVPVKCKPNVKVEEVPVYDFDKAVKTMSTFDKYKLASSERKTLRAENKELRAALKECTK